MRVVLEVTGGFTGPAGKQTIAIDTARLPVKDAEPIDRDLKRLPSAAWNKDFLKAHPKPWDFVHVLRVGDPGSERSIRFHLNEGPPELSTLVEHLTGLSSTSAT